MLAVLALLLVVPAAARATLLEKMDVEQLTQHAALIVEGTVLSTAVEQPGGEVRTAVRISVQRVLKGTPGEVVICYVPGGVLPDGTRVICDGVPTFAPGERCYVFVDVRGWVIAGFQGKLAVDAGVTQGVTLREMDARIGAAMDGRPAPAAGPATRRASQTPRRAKTWTGADWDGSWSTGHLILKVDGSTVTGTTFIPLNGHGAVRNFVGQLSEDASAISGTFEQEVTPGAGDYLTVDFDARMIPNRDPMVFTGDYADPKGKIIKLDWDMTKDYGPRPPATGPAISSITPNEVSAGTGSKIVIAGTGFGRDAGKVEFSYGYNGRERTPAEVISSWSDTQITCLVPARIVDKLTECASSGPVWVTTAAGGESAPFNDFTVTFAYVQSKWGQPAVTYRVNPANKQLGGEFPGMQAAVDAAAATWTAVGTPFKLTAGDLTWHTCETGDGLNVVGWDALGTGYLALTWPTTKNGTITECDFAFNSDYPWGAGAGEFDLQSAAVHEFGHWLYLGDLYGAADELKVMSGSLTPGVPKRVLSPEDIAGIKWVYAGGSAEPLKDTTKPVCEADDVTVRRGQLALLTLKAYDEQSPQVRIWVDILDRNGTTRREWDWGWRDSHKGWRGVRWQCTLPRGKYLIHVGAEDKAGNYGTGTAILRVI